MTSPSTANVNFFEKYCQDKKTNILRESTNNLKNLSHHFSDNLILPLTPTLGEWEVYSPDCSWLNPGEGPTFLVTHGPKREHQNQISSSGILKLELRETESAGEGGWAGRWWWNIGAVGHFEPQTHREREWDGDGGGERDSKSVYTHEGPHS